MVTGFPSPAQGYEDNAIDLNELLVKHPAATVFMRIDSSRYVNAGIYPGDLLVVDRSLEPENAAVVVRECEGRFMLGNAQSVAAGAVVCGVVTHVIHTVRSLPAPRTSRFQKREDSACGGFQKREDSACGGFQKREDSACGGFQKREDCACGGFQKRSVKEGMKNFQGRGPRA